MAKFVPSKIDQLVGQRIQRKRKELGLTAEKLSEYVDISQPQLSRYERGTNKINLTHLVAIATFLKTPMSYFFADCMDNLEWSQDELDRTWLELSQSQKSIVVQLVKEFNKTSS
ncbi:helix-turn-helix domain-containing protein [Rodentibacter trehalosifermentans]|uniref:helix-turn-helix domain-containing protein n=1 Tax=Rodentibacter trehalosifermentans TaxID=1908263 RepID=UPI0009876824|nr:helix-turn-helix transcriptional regulator [Rodentibacter trehalosifermentans]OOF52645.1 transcriptional regulator [Rodentibacter trehalosifermentans]